VIHGEIDIALLKDGYLIGKNGAGYVNSEIPCLTNGHVVA